MLEADDYICLAPGYAREALDAFDAWEDRRRAPRKVVELMMVLRVEVSKRYYPAPHPELPKIPVFKDMTLG